MVKQGYILDLLHDAADSCELWGEVDIDLYSGRGMYGAECPSITGTEHDVIRVIIEAAIIDPEVAREHLVNFSTDSMGLDVVYYWREITE